MAEPTASTATAQSQRVSARVVVIGAGISGLAAAHRLIELQPGLELQVLEASDRIGGVLQTETVDGYMCERSADNFITNVPWAIDLCRRLDVELLQTNDQHRQAFVVRKGRLQKLPQGFLIMAPTRLWPMATTPILSILGKLRMCLEYFVPKRKEETDESLESFAVRRFGRETFERLIQPLVGGIYTADPSQLSLQATMPRFSDMERQYGSLVRAVLRQRKARRSGDHHSSGGRYSMFVAPRDGMQSLVQAMADRLPEGAVRTHAAVERIEQRPGGGWSIWLTGPEVEVIEADAVILATPASRSARILAPLDRKLAEQLAQIPHATSAVVSLGYRRDQVGHRLDGFGFVVPLVEQRRILSGSFSSVKYDGRAPDGCVLFRVFVGGACQPELAELPEADLIRLAHDELTDLLDISGQPELTLVSHWRETMPQYHVGHLQLVESIRAGVDQWAGLGLAGNGYEGVGVPHCIHSGEQVAERILDELLVGSSD